MILVEKTEVLGGKPVSLPFFPPQIPHTPWFLVHLTAVS
jgi:hypothetical protein